VRWLSIWGPALLQMGAIFTLSSQPRLPSLPGGLTGYTGHFIGYFILGAALLRGFARGRWTGVTAKAAALAWIGSAVYGLSDEFHQQFVPGRTSTMGDWLADLAGAAAGVAVPLMWRRRLDRMPRNREL
jgi:VanZ family protein